MKDEELKDTLENLKEKDILEQKITHVKNDKKNSASSNFRKIVISLSACLLIVMIAIGIPYLTRNPEFITTDGTELKQGAKILLESYSVYMSSVPGYPFEFSYPDTKIVLTVNNGELFIWGPETSSTVISKGQSYTIDNSGKIYWSPIREGRTINDKTILEFRILKKDNIIGVGFIKIIKTEINAFESYSAEVLGIMGFPKSNGKYQKVSENTIAEFKATLLI